MRRELTAVILCLHYPLATPTQHASALTDTVSEAKGRRVVALSVVCQAQVGFKTNFLKNDAKTLILNCARNVVILATRVHSV